MADVPRVHVVNLALAGPPGAGKSCAVIWLVQRNYIGDTDPTIEDSYRKSAQIDDEQYLLEIFDPVNREADNGYFRDGYFSKSTWFCFFMPVGGFHKGQSGIDEQFADLEGWVRYVRIQQKLPNDAPLPAFLVGSKCDLPHQVPRVSLVSFAVKHKFQGYYEISSKSSIHIDELFFDAARMARMRAEEPVKKTQAEQAEKEANRLSGVSGALPWNWSKKAKANEKLRQIEHAKAPAPKLATIPIAEADFNDILPTPQLTVAPLAFFDDLRQLIETPEGLSLSDIALRGEDRGEAIPVHRAIVCARSELLRKLVLSAKKGKKRISVPDINTAALKYLLHYLYTEHIGIEPGLDTLLHIADVARSYGIHSLTFAAMQASDHYRQVVHLPPKPEEVAKEQQARVEQIAKVAQSSEIASICDVTFMVEGRKFELHRAILWARSRWFRALMAERWSAGGSAIEVTTMSADVFAVVVEFLYAGSTKIPTEIGLDVLIAADMLNLPRLVQMAEIALEPGVDGGNAVPLLLAAEAHGAKQLARLCKYHISLDLPSAQKHEQWIELKEMVRQQVVLEYQRVQAERALQRDAKELAQQIPCLLAPVVEGQ